VMLDLISSPNFNTQIKKVEQHAPVIAAYLMRSPTVPEEVKSFAKTLFSEAFAVAVYQKLGKVYDPNSMNRYFFDGFHDFQKMNMYRYIFDFVHGFTSVLVREHSSRLNYLERVWLAKWKTYDFRNLTNSDLDQALSTVMDAGRKRILKMRGEPIDHRTPVDVRETVEIWFGWDFYDTKFLRWHLHWDEWETMGGGWTCICFLRRTIFNPFSIRQF
jgi:hypothetical protein